MSFIASTLPDESMKAIESGMEVFFIQNGMVTSCLKSKSIPESAARPLRPIRPFVTAAGVWATSMFSEAILPSLLKATVEPLQLTARKTVEPMIIAMST